MKIGDGTIKNSSDKIVTNILEESVVSIYTRHDGTLLQAKGRHITEDSNHYSHRDENLNFIF